MRKHTYTHVQAQTHPLSLHTQTYTHPLNLFILEDAASESFHGINQEPPTQGQFYLSHYRYINDNISI